MKIYFNEDGKTVFGENYKHLATHTVEMPKPETPDNHTARPKLDLDTMEGYWEYQEDTKTEEERIEALESENLDLWDLVLFGGDE